MDNRVQPQLDKTADPAKPVEADVRNMPGGAVRVDVKPAEPKADDKPAPDPNRPSWLPEKFKTPEEFAKAYGELETKLGQPKDEPKVEEPKKDAEPKPEDKKDEPPVEKPVEKALKDAGLSFEDLSKEYTDKGELSKESYEKLDKAGFPKALVDDYVNGQKAAQALWYNECYTQAGGSAETYGQMCSWMQVNLSKDDQAAYDRAVTESTDRKAVLNTISGMYARFVAAEGSDPKLVGGDGAKAGADVFESTAQVIAAMSDPKYKQDPAYRRAVEAKIKRSSVL